MKKNHVINKNRFSRFDIFDVMPHLVKTQGLHHFLLGMKANQSSTFPFNFLISGNKERVSKENTAKPSIKLHHNCHIPLGTRGEKINKLTKKNYKN